MARKTVNDYDAELDALRAEYEAKVAKAKKQRAIAKQAENKRDRDGDTALKILVGGMVLEHMAANWKQVDLVRLDAYLARYSKAMKVARMPERLDFTEADERRRNFERAKRRRKTLKRKAVEGQAPDYGDLAKTPAMALYLETIDAIEHARELEDAKDPGAAEAMRRADEMWARLNEYRRAADAQRRAELSAGTASEAGGDGASDGEASHAAAVAPQEQPEQPTAGQGPAWY